MVGFSWGRKNVSKVRAGLFESDLSDRGVGSGAEGCVPQMRLCARGGGLREPWRTPAFPWPENTEGGGWEVEGGRG